MSKRLSFKPHVYLLEGGQLTAYNVSTGQVAEVAQLPSKGASGQALSARRLVCSTKRDACLVFFLATSAAGQQRINLSSHDARSYEQHRKCRQ